MEIQSKNVHGVGDRKHEVYDMGEGSWELIKGVPCPVDGCDQTLAWWEAGNVPGYRVCAKETEQYHFVKATLRHRFLLDPWAPGGRMILVRDDCCEATDGCIVEPDGHCPHAHPSWLLKLGLI